MSSLNSVGQVIDKHLNKDYNYSLPVHYETQALSREKIVGLTLLGGGGLLLAIIGTIGSMAHMNSHLVNAIVYGGATLLVVDLGTLIYSALKHLIESSRMKKLYTETSSFNAEASKALENQLINFFRTRTNSKTFGVNLGRYGDATAYNIEIVRAGPSKGVYMRLLK